MKKEKSPFPNKNISVNKIGEVMGYLVKYDRVIWLAMCPNSEVRLGEGTTIMGPFPNWKAYQALNRMLVFEQEQEKIKHNAREAANALGANLFLTSAQGN